MDVDSQGIMNDVLIEGRVEVLRSCSANNHVGALPSVA